MGQRGGSTGVVCRFRPDYNEPIRHRGGTVRGAQIMRILSKWLSAWVLAGAAAMAAAEPVTVERDSVVRTEPRADAAVVTNLARGATGEAVARQGAWVQVKAGTMTGWLYSFNVRFGAAGTNEGGGGGSALGRLFGPRQNVNVTATLGIRGLDEEDLKQARFDGGQMQALDGFAADRDQAQTHAGGAGLSAARVDYLTEPAAADAATSGAAQ